MSVPTLTPPIAFKRRDIILGSAALGLVLTAGKPSIAAAAAYFYKFDGSLPGDVTFKRSGAAFESEATGSLRLISSDNPRFDHRGPKVGLLLEGEARNFAGLDADRDPAAWTLSGGMTSVWAPMAAAPDGASGALCFIPAPAPATSECRYDVRPADAATPATASIWLRSKAGAQSWRLALSDIETGTTQHQDVEIDDRWQRHSVSMRWTERDAGGKRISLIRLNSDADHATEASNADGLFSWGLQYEYGMVASSSIRAGTNGQRAADALLIDAAPFQKMTGRILIELTTAGQRDGTILDSAGDKLGIRLGYSPSGWITGKVGGVELVGVGDVTQDRHVELAWTPSGAQISTGSNPAELIIRAMTPGTVRLKLDRQMRIGADAGGAHPLNAAISALEMRPELVALRKATMPAFVCSGYTVTFSDDFTDPDVSRINEKATGGRPGAPAWRSRFRQSRFTIVNKEKQIYVDPQFAGKANKALGIQPFSISDSVLTISANRADPETAPYLSKQAYTSGVITSELTFLQQYGYFEIKARMPAGKGFWPAFWLLPKRPTWPPEIDVFEGSGVRVKEIHHGILEAKDPDDSKKGKAVQMSWAKLPFDVSDGFHTYGLEWTEKELIFSADGKETFRGVNHTIHEPMYVIANLALGSHDQNWIPDPDASTPFPGRFEIDYIKISAKG
ncbi:MAG: glycoside hydrolase family 16 protein [Dongiaceae bacterium]